VIQAEDAELHALRFDGKQWAELGNRLYSRSQCIGAVTSTPCAGVSWDGGRSQSFPKCLSPGKPKLLCDVEAKVETLGPARPVSEMPLCLRQFRPNPASQLAMPCTVNALAAQGADQICEASGFGEAVNCKSVEDKP
jgi:hypothetical protein